MFTLSCSTCEAKLVVKDEQLVGKILACPNCGSMVHVQPPDDALTPFLPSKKSLRKRFPDVLTHETGSGIIGPLPEGTRRSAILLDTLPVPAVSDTEIKTRKILINILIGLAVLFLAALGFLILFHRPVPPQPLPQEPNVQVPPEEPPPIDLVPDDPPEIIDPPPENPPGVLPQEPETVPIETVHIEEAPPQKENDILTPFEGSGAERRMTDFLNSLVPDIDIDAKLTLPILDMNLNQQSLIGFVRVMSGLTGIPMTLDIDEMRCRSLSVNTPMEGQFREATAGEVLTKILATQGLQWIAVDRQILIFPKDIDEAADLTFDVSDFAENTEDMTSEALADMIWKLVCPEATITVLSDHQLTVVQDRESGKRSARLRDDIQRFLEQLRVVRQLPQQTDLTGETIAPEAFGWDEVIKPMTFNHYRPLPLSRAATQLESLTQLTILVDHQSLHQSLCSYASVHVTVQSDFGTVNDALERLLASADTAALTYRIIDPQTLEITTTESARQPEKMVVEVHPYHIQEGETPEDIVRALRWALAPESWATAESPEMQFGGNIMIDEPSSCLFIRQSQPLQRQIRLYLSEPEPLAP